MSINSKLYSDAQLARLRDLLMTVEASLSLSQLVALLTIAAEPGLSVNALADRLKAPQQTASRHVAVLAGRYQGDLAEAPLAALVVQQINEADPRRRALYLTPEGETLVAGILGANSSSI